MLIELDSDNRGFLRRLFDRYPCLHGSVAAAIEGGMGRVFADSQEESRVALAVLAGAATGAVMKSFVLFGLIRSLPIAPTVEAPHP